ncbi:DNA-directed DNA/RNA polymerase mu-like isoform X2 [Dreissena polymorpha]|uniref:DNA-directed DNA/RNA polymerase mu-like isoform X2 n=1 Tax=Dreissena polymorpha TaxID=45954 RepID=UPI0022654826|nr:DNA-directed DNA/RNA polymerase mu-like isoform X2 [Dreissena polymorpha]
MYDNPIIYILEARIQRQRLKDMQNSARKRQMSIAEQYSSSVTHIVTEFDNADAVARKLGLESARCLNQRQVVKLQWFADCIRAGCIVPVDEHHKVKSGENNQVAPPVSARIPDYACQRHTPLQHHNTKFTDALEILEKYADLRYDDQDYSRALAFRRASCVLKSLSRPLSRLSEIQNVTHIGSHSQKVIQEILEDGTSEEVEKICADPWFQKMKLFTAIFGIGPARAKEFIAKGWSSIQEVRDGCTSSDWRIQWGLAFHEDLTTPVTRAEADYILGVVRRHVDRVLPGAVMELTGGFRRGKQTGHDVDILIMHPLENKIIGALPRLLQSLQSHDIVLCGRHERSTYHEELLTQNTKLSPRGQLDHFEKWIGIIKVPNKIRIKNDQSDKTSSHQLGNNKCNTDMKENKDKCENRNFQSDKNTDSCKRDVGNESVLYQRQEDTLDSGSAISDSLEDVWESLDKASSSSSPSHGNPREVKASQGDWIARRVDLIISPFSQFFYALVGWTGSKQFNRDARTYAEREMNMKLSSHGLYDFNQGKQLVASSEREVFDNLKLPYFEPQDRNC